MNNEDQAALPEHLHARLESTRQLKAAWGAVRFVTWAQFIKYFDPGASEYSTDVIARTDKIWEKIDVNAFIEARLLAMRNGDHVEASRLRGELLAAGIELNDEVSAISKTVSTRWGLAR